MRSRARVVVWREEPNVWRWQCSFCWPITNGTRYGAGAWHKIMTISLPHHFRVRDQHHEHMRGRA